jgi:hypothetical protein
LLPRLIAFPVIWTEFRAAMNVAKNLLLPRLIAFAVIRAESGAAVYAGWTKLFSLPSVAALRLLRAKLVTPLVSIGTKNLMKCFRKDVLDRCFHVHSFLAVIDSFFGFVRQLRGFLEGRQKGDLLSLSNLRQNEIFGFGERVGDAHDSPGFTHPSLIQVGGAV